LQHSAVKIKSHL